MPGCLTAGIGGPEEGAGDAARDGVGEGAGEDGGRLAVAADLGINANCSFTIGGFGGVARGRAGSLKSTRAVGALAMSGATVRGLEPPEYANSGAMKVMAVVTPRPMAKPARAIRKDLVISRLLRSGFVRRERHYRVP